MISVSQKTNNTCKIQCKLMRPVSKFSVEEFIKDLQKNLTNFDEKNPTITDRNKVSRKQKRIQNKRWITKGQYQVSLLQRDGELSWRCRDEWTIEGLF